MAALCCLVAACGGGGGDAPAPAPAVTPPAGTPPPSPQPPPPAPPPPTIPPTTVPPVEPDAVALARPLTTLTLCGNGLRHRYQQLAPERRFNAVAAVHGITHRHHVDTQEWTQHASAYAAVMRTGAVLATSLKRDCWPDLVFATGARGGQAVVGYVNTAGNYKPMPSPLVLATDSNVVAGLDAADLDGDYRLELVTGNLLPGTIAIYSPNDDGDLVERFAIASSRSTFGFAFADYTRDAWLDAYAAHWDADEVAGDSPVLLANAAADAPGELLAVDTAAGLPNPSRRGDFAASFVDIDGDSLPDVLVSADRGASEALLASDAGSFSSVTDRNVVTVEDGAGSAVADFDNDGRWDWFVAGVAEPLDGRPWPFGGGGNALYWGTGTAPYFERGAPTGVERSGWSFGACAADFDNDGRTDLFVENGFGYVPASIVPLLDAQAMSALEESLFDMRFTRAALFMNRGNREFVDEAESWGIAAATNGRGVACFDYDRDGDIDIAVAQNSAEPLVYQNRAAARTGNAFVAVRLLATEPNTHAVGAVVTVKSGGETQFGRVSGEHSAGRNAYELHFGLGGAAIVDEIAVRWPHGATSVYANVPVNRFVTLLDRRLLPYAEPSRLEGIEAAAAAAAAFVAANPDSLPDDVMVALTAMMRQHDLSLPYSPAEILSRREQRLASDGFEGAAAVLRAYRRIYNPSAGFDATMFSRLEGLDAITLRGVYCHALPLDEAYFGELAVLNDGGGYGSTHALLALIWAIDNDCPLPAGYGGLVGMIVRAVAAAAADGAGADVTDLRLEALLMLVLAGRHDLIRAEWVDEVLAAQLPNGGWAATRADPEPSGHSSGIGLWLMLTLAADRRIRDDFIAQLWLQ